MSSSTEHNSLARKRRRNNRDVRNVDFDVLLTGLEDTNEEFLAEFMSNTTDLEEFHLPCFPTPPYEGGPEDDWMAEFDADHQLPSGPGSLGGGDSSSDDLSELRCVHFSDILLNTDTTQPTTGPCLTTMDASDGEQMVTSNNSIENAPPLADIEVDHLLNNLGDLDIPDFSSEGSASPILDHFGAGNNIEMQDSAIDLVKSENISDNVKNCYAAEVTNVNKMSSAVSGSDPAFNNYKGKLRKRLGRPTGSSTATPSTAEVMPGEADDSKTYKSNQPALEMLKVSQFAKEKKSSHSRGRCSDSSAAALSSFETEVDLETDKRSKGARQAKINREKNKAHRRNLEAETVALRAENETLRGTFRKLERSRSSLQQEVEYLRSVLENQSMLAGLLKNIGNTQGVALSSSFVKTGKCKSSDETVAAGCSSSVGGTVEDHDYGQKRRRQQIHSGKQGPSSSWSQNVATTTTMTTGGGGICLHVRNNENVSLEFCSTCARRATRGGSWSSE